MFNFTCFSKKCTYKNNPKTYVSYLPNCPLNRNIFSTAHDFSVSQKLWQTPKSRKITLFYVLGNELRSFFWSQVAISAQGCHTAAKYSMTEEDIKVKVLWQHLEITCKEFKSITIRFLVWIPKTPQQSIYYSSRKRISCCKKSWHGMFFYIQY